MKAIPPTLNLPSFNCPHCDAFAQQTWYDVCATASPNNQPTAQYDTASNVQVILNQINLKNWSDKETLKMSLVNIRFKINEYNYADSKVDSVFLSECNSCHQISVWAYDNLIHPVSTNIEAPNEDMPQDIQAIYNEARGVFNNSPRSAAALLRLCIEKICAYLEVKGKLDEQIGELVKRGLDQKIQRALDSVRLIGNSAVHSGQIDLNDNRDVALKLFRLVNIIVQQLITDAREINEIYDLLPENKKNAISRRDS